MVIAPLLTPSPEGRSWLRKHAGSAVAPRRSVERCQIILRTAEGETNEQVAQALGITRQKVARRRGRFAPEAELDWSRMRRDVAASQRMVPKYRR